MTAIKEQCIYICGPYKNYCGKADYDQEAEIFHGSIAGTRDVVTFQGRNPTELRKAFRESVDDYLEFCKSRNESPEKPFSGKFMTRIDPEVHKKISLMAGQAGKSLNQFICDCLESIAEGVPPELPCAAPAATAAWSRTNGKKKSKARGRKKKAYA